MSNSSKSSNVVTDAKNQRLTLYSKLLPLICSPIVGSSMRPTLFSGDVVYGRNKYWCKPKIGDIVIAVSADNSIVIKRLIAKSGDIVDFDGPRKSYKVRHKYTERHTRKGKIKSSLTTNKEVTTKYSITVPKGYVFVVGDNEKGSRDCRDYGAIKSKNVLFVVTSVIHKQTNSYERLGRFR